MLIIMIIIIIIIIVIIIIKIIIIIAYNGIKKEKPTWMFPVNFAKSSRAAFF